MLLRGRCYTSPAARVTISYATSPWLCFRAASVGSQHESNQAFQLDNPASKMITLLELNHVALLTHDVAASVRFYCDVLGFRELIRPPFRFAGAWLRGAGLTIHIIENATLVSHPNETLTSRANHIAFAVASVSEVKDVLTSRGIPFTEQVNAAGSHQIFCRDPAGNAIEIAVYTTPAGTESLAESLAYPT